MHILRLNCAETIQDTPGQPTYEMFGIKRRFQRCKGWLLKFKESSVHKLMLSRVPWPLAQISCLFFLYSIFYDISYNIMLLFLSLRSITDGFACQMWPSGRPCAVSNQSDSLLGLRTALKTCLVLTVRWFQGMVDSSHYYMLLYRERHWTDSLFAWTLSCWETFYFFLYDLPILTTCEFLM